MSTTKRVPDFQWLLWVVALAALGLAFLAYSHQGSSGTQAAAARPGLVENIDRLKKIRAGYGVFPPYTMEDPKTGKVSGISVDIVNEIGRQLGVKVEWKRFNWNTMKADLDRGEFDLLADAVFQTPARGREMTFTEPYAFLPIGIGVVRKGDTRFSQFDEINDARYRVAVGEGFAEETFIRARAPQAQVISIQSASDTAAPINAVLTGRADIAIVNIEDAKRFLAAHGDGLQALWTTDPPAYAPAGFVVRYGDLTGAQFLNAGLRNLSSTGVISSIMRRYGVTPVSAATAAR